VDRVSPAAKALPDSIRRGRRGTGKVRLADVAKLAGVAPITASRAVNAPDSVSPETLRRVREAIERTGYVPNLLAGGLASTRSRLVAAVVPTVASPVFQQTWESLTEALAGAGFQLTLGQSGYVDSREDELLEAIIGRRPDAIVLTGIVRSARGRLRLLAAGIPVVETWDITPTPIDMLVGFSHEKIGAAVADYLYAQGRRCLGIITASDDRARRRAKGMVDAAAARGIAGALAPELPMALVSAPGTLGSGRRALADLLSRHSGIDAVFCSSDMLALGVVTEAAARGIAVPHGIAVVGYGDLNFAPDTMPPLTTVSVDGTAIGRLAAGLIIDRVQGRPVPQNVIDVGFSIVRRQSA
jgi:LacI family gluconate utilization system Gnt-I transcriptional repressor